MVGARAPGTEQISQRVFLSFLTAYKKKKNVFFFEGCPVGWGGYPSGLVDGGVDQGP